METRYFRSWSDANRPAEGDPRHESKFRQYQDILRRPDDRTLSAADFRCNLSEKSPQKSMKKPPLRRCTTGQDRVCSEHEKRRATDS
jgi:hypothetical protein